MASKNTPYCPLKSAGNDVEVICSEERCAWFLKPYNMCCVYILAHNAALDIQAKQHKQK